MSTSTSPLSSTPRSVNLRPSVPDDLVLAMHMGDPTAAIILHRRYADGIAAHIRHKLPGVNPSNAVLEVLLAVIRTVRDGINDPGDLTPMVLQCTRRHVKQLASERQPALESSLIDLDLQRRAALANRIFTSLHPQEREILMRTYLLLQDDPTIAVEMQLSFDTLIAVRRKIRRMFYEFVSLPLAPVAHDIHRKVAIN